MALTPEQRVALKADILANQDAADLYNEGNLSGLAVLYNAPAAPAFFVWRTSVAVADIMRNGFDWTRVDNLTVGKARIWEFMTDAGILDPSQPNVRAGFEACFSVEAGDQSTRQAIYNHSARPASRIERLFAVGTGDAPTHHGVGPATMAYQGPLLFTELIGL